ncbi:hypothetical protein PAL_GLEAN10002236 [Pteropus alecto]|uniref:Uncharacterized protein n=1 Tax=Pteropus alecto TaxID=9402 RepID=L5JTW7_PTEAL|nr:hypothetical protein PAL_GLEAN10002236 [Pteropus alecto]
MEIAPLSTTGLPGVCADSLRWDGSEQQQRPGQALDAPLTCGLAEEVEGPQGMHVLGLVAEEGRQQGDPREAVRP